MNFSLIQSNQMEYAKEMIMKAYQFNDRIIRETASNVISLVLYRGGLNIWPGILEFFIHQLESKTEEEVETACKAICFIVEDSGRAFEDPIYSEEMDKMLPSLSKVLMTYSQNSSIQSTVIHTINMLVLLSTETVYNSTEDYLLCLLSITKSSPKPLTEVLKRCVQGITNILDFRMELILAHAEEVGEAMLQALQSMDQHVGLAAAEFWSGIVINGILIL
jgi:hypothetical protein